MLNVFIQSEWKTALIVCSLLMTLHTSFKPLPQTPLLIYEGFSTEFSCYLVHAFDHPFHPSPKLFQFAWTLLGVGDPDLCSCVYSGSSQQCVPWEEFEN